MSLVAALPGDRPRKKGRHVRLVDYRRPDVACGDAMPPACLGCWRELVGYSTPADEIAALPEDYRTLRPPQPIDCPDCGRTVAERGRCRGCGGASWAPAGYVDRAHVRALRRPVESGEEG